MLSRKSASTASMRVCTSVEVAKKIIMGFNMVQQDVRLASKLRHRVHLLLKGGAEILMIQYCMYQPNFWVVVWDNYLEAGGAFLKFKMTPLTCVSL